MTGQSFHSTFIRCLGILLLPLTLATLMTCSSIEMGAEDVIQRYCESIGGKETLLSKKSRISEGKFSIPDMGMTGNVTAYLMPPDHAYTEINIAGMKAMSGVGDGIAWDSNPMTGKRILEGDEKRAALRRTCWDPIVEWKQFYDSIQLMEEEPDSNKFRISMKSSKDKSQALADFDRENYHLIKLITFDGENRTTTWFSDYRPADGLILPHKIISDFGGQLRVETELDKVEHDREIPPKIFEFPESIKALID